MVVRSLCRARQALVVAIVCVLSDITCAAGVNMPNDLRELSSCDSATVLDAVMIQTFVVPFEVENDTYGMQVTGSSHHHHTMTRVFRSSRAHAMQQPVPTPAPTCVDTNNGATNRFGNGCELYMIYDYLCLDPYYDDEDFSSGVMCCVCPEECAPTEASVGSDGCEDWIEFRTLGSGMRNSHSNLGGLGPDAATPKEIRYYHVGRLSHESDNEVVYDLVLVNTSAYVPRNTDWNTVRGSQATVNVLVGETVTLKAEFVRNHTFCPVIPDSPKITFCDIDHFADGENEIIMLDGISALYTVDGDTDYTLELYEHGIFSSEDLVPLTYTAESIPTLVPGRTSRRFVSSSGSKFAIKAISRMFGSDCDNPTDPNELTNVSCPGTAFPVDQAKRCFMAEFTNTSEFDVGFQILTYHPAGHVQEWGRNFIMSGTSRLFAHEGSQTCAPTATVTTSVTTATTTTQVFSAPAPAPCVDTDNGATNRLGNGCEVYTHDAGNPYAGICLDPYYDDEDFSSGVMCCVCPEECPPTEAFAGSDGCEDWIEFNTWGSGVRNPHSNLGGMGPDVATPKEIRYYHVGRLSNESDTAVLYDLVLVNTSAYVPRNTGWNTVRGSQATVNVLVGETITLKAEFVVTHTFCPVVPDSPKITFCDIDHFADGENEVIMLDGISALYTVDGDTDYTLELYEHGTPFSEDPAPLSYVVESIPTLVPGRTSRRFVSSSGGNFAIKAISRMFGSECDNPTDPNELTNVTCPDHAFPVDQAKRCFMAEFTNTSEFDVGFQILTYHPAGHVQEWGRNFIMSGTSRLFAHEGSQTCTPTTTVTTTTTAATTFSTTTTQVFSAPATAPCVDTDNGATNRRGNGCEVYTHDADNPYAGICLDPYYDDEDFSSGVMCCVCPEECPPTDAFARSDGCEDWIEFSTLGSGVRNPHSNLGGMGPDVATPKEIRYYHVGRLSNESDTEVLYDLVLVNTSTYVPRNTGWNTVRGSQATVNVLVGETITLKAEFVVTHTFCPVVPDSPKITFCDIDHFADGENEIIMLDGISALYTVDGDTDYFLELYEHGTPFSEDQVPLSYVVETIPTLVPGRTSRRFVSSSGSKFAIKATSRMFGSECDNPTDPNELTNVTCPDHVFPVDQAKRCFMAEFTNTSDFDVGFQILTYHPAGHVQEWGRNFIMSGTSKLFAHEGSQTCTPTTAVTTTATTVTTSTTTTTQCVDTDNGATNRFGNGCEVYTHDAESPYAGICLDPYYDDEDFTSGLMCCVCPEECPPPEQFERPGHCEDWIEFHTLGSGVRNPHSNLGGLGPDVDTPKEIRYYGVGRFSNGVVYDLVLVNTSAYIPRNTAWNTIIGPQAIVNTLVGQTITLKGEFVRNHTFCPVIPESPKITFCDIDHFVDGENEIIMLDGISALYTVDGDIDYVLQLVEHGTSFTENPVPVEYTTEAIPTMVPGRTSRRYVSSSGGKFGVKAISRMFGHSCDNPTDSNELSNVTCPDQTAVPVDQAKRCFMVEFSNTSEFDVGFQILTRSPAGHVQQWGRNFIMSGTSKFFARDGSSTCAPITTTTTTTTVDSSGVIMEKSHGANAGPVSGTGDPHLQNINGERFDLMQAGRHVLLHIPRGVGTAGTLLRAEARAQRFGGCSDLYFQER
ncbi:unnamed protein product [Prorocentrum cordatum]|uniref:Subtilisin n=1 Tax=Prorocentrum cordatum TaxID=2364126 RepID=A0ABN9R5Q8_9DINO|nr:unnamed protein product [Polarella glacialis]